MNTGKQRDKRRDGQTYLVWVLNCKKHALFSQTRHSVTMSLARLLTLRRRRRRSEPSSELMPLDPKEEDGANGNGSQDVGGYTVLFQDEPMTHVSTTEAPEIKRRLQLLTRWLRRASGTQGSLRQQRPASLTADTAMEGTDGQFVFVPIERTKTRRRPLTELLMPRRFRMPKFSFKRWRRGNKANDESIGLLSPEGSRQNYQSNKDNDDEYDESMDIRFVIDQVLTSPKQRQKQKKKE